MTSAAAILPDSIRSYVGDFIARRRRYALLRAIAVAMAFGLTWMLAACLIDRLTALPAMARLVLLLADLAAMGVLLRRPVTMWFQHRNDYAGAAALIEDHNPAFAGRLQTVISRLLGPERHRGSPQMLQQVLQDVAEQVTQEDPARLLPRRMVARPWAAAGAILLLLPVLTLWPWLDLPRLMLRFVAPLTGTPAVTRTRLVVVRPAGGDAKVLQGQTLRFVVQARLLDGEAVKLHTSIDGGQNWSAAMMPPLELQAGAGETYGDAVPDAGGLFSLTSGTIDRDMSWYVSGGDAATPIHAVRVLRRPAASGFRIRYVYPAYTHLSPLMVSNTDGLIEAPVGTEATAAVVATEPLESAVLVLGDQRIAMTPTVEPAVWQAMLTVQKDQPYRIELTSTAKVAGDAGGASGAGGEGGLRIRAVPDRPPVVRLLQPEGDLRLHPRDILTLHYQAMDDYGVVSLAAQVQVNGANPPRQLPIALGGDARRQERRYDLDLATLDLKIGDLVNLSLRGQDAAGQSALSESRVVLVSPRSIDLNAHLRIAELKQAAELADTLVRELESASRTFDELRSGAASAQYMESWHRLNQHLGAVSEASTLLRQSLLRAIIRSPSPAISLALASLSDAVHDLPAVGEDVMASLGDRERETTARHQCDLVLEREKAMQGQVRMLLQAEQATAVLADQENLRTLSKPPQGPATTATMPATAPDARLPQVLDRARQDIAAGAAGLGLDPNAADLATQLQAKVQAARQFVDSQQPIDFPAAATAWANDLSTLDHPKLRFGQRLNAAAEAEAVRPDAALVAARDLQLAGQAADAIELRLAGTGGAGPAGPGAAGGDGTSGAATTAGESGGAGGATTFPAGLQPQTDYPPAMAALRKAHDLDRLPKASRPPAPEQAAVRATAAEARQKMIRWAGQADLLARDDADSDLPDRDQFQRLALEAAAEAAQGRYARAAELDEKLKRWLPKLRMHPPDWLEEEWRRLDRAMGRTQKLDELAEEQEQLGEATAAAAPDQVSQLAQRQGAVAKALAAVHRESLRDRQAAMAAERGEAGKTGQGDDAGQRDDAEQGGEEQANSRERALSAIQAAQAQLATMPQQLGQTQQAAQEQRQAGARATRAKQSAAKVPPEGRSIANRYVAQAQKSWTQARHRTAEVAAPVSVDAAQSLSSGLVAFTPETSGAVEVIDQQLTPALRQLQQGIDAEDAAGVDKAATQARTAISQAQAELRKAQAELMDRDPLVAAKLFAEAAAQSLSRSPADLQAAGVQQRDTSAALARAWDNSVHEVATQRLSGVPGMQALFGVTGRGQIAGDGPGRGDRAAAPVAVPALRQWGRLRPRQPEGRSAPVREADPPGYEEALRIYFETLGQGGQGGQAGQAGQGGQGQGGAKP